MERECCEVALGRIRRESKFMDDIWTAQQGMGISQPIANVRSSPQWPIDFERLSPGINIMSLEEREG
jgi:hypothetical protein